MSLPTDLSAFAIDNLNALGNQFIFIDDTNANGRLVVLVAKKNKK